MSPEIEKLEKLSASPISEDVAPKLGTL